MRDIRVQFFLTFASLGTVLPYISVFFRQNGLNGTQVGYAFAIWSLTAVFSPAVLTWVADKRVDPRGLLALTAGLTAVSLAMLGFARGPAMLLAVWTIYCLSSIASFPLQDGVHFSLQRRRAEAGERTTAYHFVRAWGTVGFITPSVMLFVLLRPDMSLRGALFVGATFALLAAIQALWLPDPRPRHLGKALPAADDVPTRLPTVEAAAALLRPRMLVFCVATTLVLMAAAIHSAFYPLYLTEQVHLSEKWLGPASNLAVVVEIGLMFGCGWLLHLFGIKRLLVIGMLATALRFGLIALSNSPWAAIGTQALHGIMILATGVIPHKIFDNHADDRFRHSMQGLLMMITAGGQSIACFVAGRFATHGLDVLFGSCAGLCLGTSLIILLFWSEDQSLNRHGTSRLPADHVAQEKNRPLLDRLLSGYKGVGARQFAEREE